MRTKLARVSRRVTKLSYSCWFGKPSPTRVSKTIQRGTMKYLPFIIQTVQTQYIDLKSVENATIDVIEIEAITLMLNIAAVMIKQELKNLSRNDSGDDVPKNSKDALRR